MADSSAKSAGTTIPKRYTLRIHGRQTANSDMARVLANVGRVHLVLDAALRGTELNPRSDKNSVSQFCEPMAFTLFAHGSEYA